MIDNEGCQTMQNDRQCRMTDNGEWHTMGMVDNGGWQAMQNDRQWGMTDNSGW